MTRFRTLAALVAAAALAACGDKQGQRDITAPAPGAFVKFFNFGVGAPGVNFYANDTKVSAITSAADTVVNIGTSSGAAASGGFYSVLTPGQVSLSGRITAATDNGLAIATLPTTLEDGKSYSFYLSGIYNTTAKTSDAFVVADDYPAALDYSGAYVRFVNAISNANPQTLYAKSTSDTLQAEVAIGGPVAYRSAGTFMKIPAGTYTLNTRNTGSSTNVITRTGVSFTAGRVYTISSRGDITVTSTTAATRPQLDNTANR
jgi:hypothetical protein